MWRDRESKANDSAATADATSCGTPGKTTLVETVYRSAKPRGAEPVSAPAAFKAATSGAASQVPYRKDMERAFGEDFGGVKAYLGGGAAGGLDALGARAAAQGDSVAFESAAPDREVVAHELTHVVQQRRGGGGAPQAKAEVSDPSDAAEVEADTVAVKAAAGERVTVTGSASASIHRDIKSGVQKVPLGEYAIDMAKKDDVGGRGGEEGTVSFKPSDKAPDSKSIRMVQIVRTHNLDKGAELDWSKDGSGAEADRNKVQTKAAEGSHVCVKGETLESVALAHYGTAARHAEIYAANKDVLKSDKPKDEIPAGTALKIPKAVDGGFFVDHQSSDPKAEPRKTAADKQVSQNYGDYWSAPKTYDGKKEGATLKDASLWDRPMTPAHLRFSFETVARSDDIGLEYGTMFWSFEVKDKKVSNETWSVGAGTSDTFDAAQTEFNKFYKNEHRVMQGDTLESISIRYFGDNKRAEDIYLANKDKIPDKAKLAPGILLKVPGVSPAK
jgi:nucleoid-associated protein YgaU